MATYVNDLRLKEIATGDESGTWGTSTNTNLELIAEAFSFGTEAITTNADTHTTTIADGSTDPGRSIYLKYTGTLDSACTITIGPNTVSKLWFIENATSGSQNIIISQGSGANVTIPAGHVKAVYSDGAGSGAAIVDAFTDLNLAGTTTVSVLSVSSTTTFSDDVTFTGASNNLVWDKSDDCLEFADNAKAKFGASDDLQIYHDGSNSRIQEAGTGSLLVRGSNLQLQDSDGFDYLTCTDGGDGGTVVLKHLGSTVLSTASGGVTVTGALTADDLEIDSGTLSVDASNNRVGINTTSPSSVLHVAGTQGTLARIVGTNASSDVRLLFDAGGTNGQIQYAGASHASLADTLTLVTQADVRTVHAGSQRFTIKSDGDTGIGQTAPNSPLEIAKNITFSSADTFPQLLIRTSTSGTTGNQLGLGVDEADDLAFIQAIDRGNDSIPLILQRYSNRVGIGTDSPTEALSISSDDGRVSTTSNVAKTAGVLTGGYLIYSGDGSGAGSGNRAGIQSFSTNSVGSIYDLRFYTTDGSTNLVEGMRLNGDGTLQTGTAIGNSTYAGLFNGVKNVGTGAIIQTRNGNGNKHFMLRGDNNVEYGSIGLNSTSGTASLQIQGEDSIVFKTNTDTERVRINGTGDLFLGTTSAVRGSEIISVDAGTADVMACKTSAAGLIIRKTSFSNGFLLLFEVDSNGFAVGSITSDGSSTSYTSASDYRLKENVQPMENGLDRVRQLNPVKFTWKDTGKESEGFIAHEFDEIYSGCVDGEKDGEQMQTLDYGKITPLLVKAIQEQQEQIDALQSEINNLKGE